MLFQTFYPPIPREGEDAVLADTTGLDLEGSFQLLLGLVRERLGSKEERA